MTMWNDYEKIARRLDRIAKAFERIANALETANIIEADYKTEPKPICESCSKNPCKKKKMINDIGHWVSDCTEFDRNTEQTEPQKMCDADCNEDCTECAKEWQDWKDQMWTEAVIASKTEPQTDCAWQNDEHIPTDLASTMLKSRFKEQK